MEYSEAIEKQAAMLACRRSPDARRASAETRFRSPPLALFDLGPDEWLLALWLLEYAPRTRGASAGPLQLPLLLEAPAG